MHYSSAVGYKLRQAYLQRPVTRTKAVNKNECVNATKRNPSFLFRHSRHGVAFSLLSLRARNGNFLAGAQRALRETGDL